MSGFAAMVVATAAMVGQAEQESNYQHLKFMEWTIGHWSGEGTNAEGEKTRFNGKIQWLKNKSALREEWTCPAQRRSGQNQDRGHSRPRQELDEQRLYE